MFHQQVYSDVLDSLPYNVLEVSIRLPQSILWEAIGVGCAKCLLHFR